MTQSSAVNREVEVMTDIVTEGAALAIHGLFDSDGAAPASGSALPPLWHYLAFLPRVPQAQLGRDGHPKYDLENRMMDLPQRMLAGSQITFASGAQIDRPLVRRSVVESTVEKMGRSGPLVFVTHRHEIECGGVAVIEERQNIVYRPSSTTTSRPIGSDNENEALDWPWTMDVSTDNSFIFRFSALTYNAHRIHYDLPYATSEEGYPGLVVQGPLQAIGLAELCRRFSPNESVASFEYRAIRPQFSEGHLHLRGRRRGSDVDLVAFDDDGVTTMEASAVLRN